MQRYFLGGYIIIFNEVKYADFAEYQFFRQGSLIRNRLSQISQTSILLDNVVFHRKAIIITVPPFGFQFHFYFFFPDTKDNLRK